jgi:hypothetical protein
MTDEELKQIEERAANATRGPWRSEFRHAREVVTEGEKNVWGNDQHVANLRPEHSLRTPGGVSLHNGTYCEEQNENNAEFIAHAREDVPALVAEVKRLRAALQTERDQFHGRYCSMHSHEYECARLTAALEGK